MKVNAEPVSTKAKAKPAYLLCNGKHELDVYQAFLSKSLVRQKGFFIMQNLSQQKLRPNLRVHCAMASMNLMYAKHFKVSLCQTERPFYLMWKLMQNLSQQKLRPNLRVHCAMASMNLMYAKHFKVSLFCFLCFCCFTSHVNSYGHCGTVSSPNHTLFLGKLERAVNQYFVHINSLVTDNNPSWMIQRKGGEWL